MKFWEGVICGFCAGVWFIVLATWARARYWKWRLDQALAEHVVLEAEAVVHNSITAPNETENND